jgi:branched-chain amino acid transport system substrate-binding protein
MKNHGFPASRLFIIMLALVLIVSFLFTSCAKGTTTTTTSKSPTQTSSTVTTPTQTLKIGLLANYAVPAGTDGLKIFKLLADLKNKNGGLAIGGVKYQLQVVGYDAGTTQDSEIAALNKMVYQDGIKYIIECAGAAPTALPAITEPNKVIVFIPAMSVRNWDPSWKYTFDGDASNVKNSVFMGWVCKNYPEETKNFVMTYSEDGLGNMLHGIFMQQFGAFGVTPKGLSYPASLSDYSSIGTKVASMNPSMFSAVSPSAVTNGLISNAVRQAGYKGLIIQAQEASYQDLAASFSPEALDGLIAKALPQEFSPAKTPEAEAFMKTWLASGETKINSAALNGNWFALITALEKAGSIDSTAVANVLSSGMKYNSINGECQMIGRPDVPSGATYNSICTVYIKEVKIVNGQAQPVLKATIGIEEGLIYFLATQTTPTSSIPAK